MVLPLLIGGALALGGGLIAQNAQNKAEANWNRRADAARKEPQIIRNHVDLRRLRRDAEAAGFNPLTVLRSGGLAGYNVQQHPNLHPLPNVNHGASPLGNAMQSLGGQVFDFGAQSILQAAQIASNEGIARQSMASIASMSPSLGGGPAFAAPNVIRKSGGALSSGGHIGSPSQHLWEQEVPGVTNPSPWDWWESHPRAADVETGFGQRYGEPGEWLGAPVTFAMDMGWNAARGVHALTGFDPRTIPDVIQSWASMGNGAPQRATAPLSITVGGPNQTAH